jgi:hypothetical protein
MMKEAIEHGGNGSTIAEKFAPVYPAWQREYEASLHEPDPKKLLERVHAVEAAIFNRLSRSWRRPPKTQIKKLKSRLLRKRSKLYAF